MTNKEAMKLALEALEYIANETYDPWTNGAEAGRIAQTTLSKIKNKCRAIQTSDQMTCECGNVWDMNDPYPPKCTALREALAEQALDKMAENARALGLDYEPAQQEPVAWMTKPGSVWKTKADETDQPLYTSPPAQRTWQGLTDEDIDYLCELAYENDEELILTVQAKLKEKNT